MAENPTTPLLDRAALDESFAGYTPFIEPARISGTPFTPPSFPIPTVDGEPTPTALSAWENMVLTRPGRTGQMTGGSIMRSISEMKSNRYENFMPGDYDNEDAYAQGQSWADKMVNGVAKGLILTGTTFLQSTIGLVNGLVNWKRDGKFSSFYNNDFNRGLDNLTTKIDNEYLPNYYTNVEKNAHWYSPDKLFTANFLWNGIVKNMGFAAGAALAGGTYAAGIKALSALPGISRLVSIGKQAEVLAATEEGLLAADKAASTYGKIKSLSDKFLSSYNVLSPGGRAVVAGLSTTGEAGFEALQNMNEFRDKRIQDYMKANNGVAPTGADLEKIDREAENVGNASFLANVGLLSATNYIQFPKILGSSYKAEKGWINGISREIEDIVDDGTGKFVRSSVPKTKFGKIVSTLNKIRPYTFSASEAFEEGAQYAIQVGTQDYYKKQYNGEATSFLDSLAQGVSETLGTDQGMENVLIGGLSGSLMMAKGKFAEQRQIARDTAAAIESFTNHKLSDFTKETINSINRGTKIQEERETLLRQGDIMESKDKEADYIINYLTPRIKYGRYDLVRADIEDARRLVMTPGGFEQLQAEGKALKSDTKEAYLQRLSNLENTANNIKSLYQSLILRYGNLVDDNNKPLYSNDVMNKMIYAATKVSDYDKRTSELSGILTSAGISVDDVINGKVKGNEESYNEAVEKIVKMADSKEINDDQRDELLQNLNDVAEIGLRRQKFMEEYNEIKKSPQDFQEKPVPPADNTNRQTISVKTKKGAMDLEIGEEYFVGRVVEKDKDGRDVYRAPRITILGQNDDGSIQIKTSEGEVRNVPANILIDYNLGKVGDMQANPNANFFLNHWNSIFQFNFGKDPKTNKPRTREGRLEYSLKDDQLFFIYKNKRGQERSIEVNRDQFVAKKGFKDPMIKHLGELTSAQQRAWDWFTSSPSKPVAQREGTLKMLSDVYNDVNQRHTEVKKLIEQKREELGKINTELAELEKKIESGDITKKGAFKASTSRAIKSARRLSRLQDQLTNELTNLENEREELEMTEDYIVNLLDNVDQYPVVDTDLIDDLKEERAVLHDLILDTGMEINQIKDLIGKVQDALETAVNFALDLIKKFESKYPNLPVAPLELKNFIQKELDTKGIWGEGYETYMKVNPDLLKDLYEFDRELADIDELDVMPNERTLKELHDRMEVLTKQLEEVAKQLKAKDNVISRFEAVHNKYEAQRREEEEMAKNEELKTTLMSSDERSIQTRTYSEDFEPEAKKTNFAIMRSTKAAPSELPHHKRANRLGQRFGSLPNRGSIRGVLVTSKTEGLIKLSGLTKFLKENSDATEEEKASVNPDKTIVMVLMEEGRDGVLRPVDEFGKPLEDPTFDNAVFQVMPDPSLSWSKKYGGGSMFREGTYEENEKYYRQEYKKWSDGILAMNTLDVHTINASFGIPEYVTRLDEKGVPVRDYTAVTSAEEAGLVSEEDLTERPVIFIPTTNEDIRKGSTFYEDVLGRPFINTPDGYFPLQNQKFTEKKAQLIYQAIYELSKEAKNDPKLESDRAKQLYNWLKSVVYWGKVRNRTGFNSIFFRETEDGLRLFLSDRLNEERAETETVDYSFTPTSIENNKAVLIDRIMKMYPNIRYDYAQEGTDQANPKWRMPYEEIISIDANGEIKSKLWPNYQTYLLSRKGRADNEVPFYTQLKPITPTNPTNRKGIYFTITDMPDAYKDVVRKSATKTKGVKPAGAAASVSTSAVKAPATKPGPNNTRIAPPNEFILEEDVINTAKSKASGLEVRFVATPAAADPANKDAIKIVKGDDLGKVLDAEKKKVTDDAAKQLLNKDNPTSEELEAAKTEIAKSAVVENIRTLIKAHLAAKPTEAPSNEIQFFDLSEEAPAPVAKTTSVTSPATQSIEAPVFGGFEQEEGGKSPAAGLSQEQRLMDRMNSLSPDAPMRAKVKEQLKKFTPENWKDVEKWLKANFPNIPVYRVKNAIIGTNGMQAWGMLKDGAIYLLENAEVGTAYHEVFEAVWKMFTDAKEQAAVLDEFKARKGSFTDFLGNTVKYSQASDLQAKEQLAEEFRDYILYKKIPAKPTEGRPFILKLFADLANFIKEFFTGEKAQVNTANLFDRIGRGYYKSFTPFDSTLSFATKGFIDGIEEVYGDHYSEFRIKNVSADRAHEMMEHMTYTLLTKLLKDNKSLFNLPKYGKSEIYAFLKNNLVNTALLPGAAAQLELKEDDAQLDKTKKISQDQRDAAQDIINKSAAFAKTIEDEWNEIAEKHEEFMRKYSIEFDENDEVTLTDEDAAKKGDWQDANKIDVIKKANSAVKLFLSTIPVVDNNGNFVRSSFGGVRINPMGKVFMGLMNNIHTSRGVDDMLNRIHKMAGDDSTYQYVYTRLTKTPFDPDKTTDIDQVPGMEVHDGQLIGAFWSTFRKQNPDVKNVFIFENGDIEIGDSNLGTASRQIRNEYENEMIKRLRTDKEYFTFDSRNKVYVPIPSAFAKKFNTSIPYMVEFLKTLGINFRVDEIYKLRTEEQDAFVDAVNGIYESIKKKEKIATFSGKVLGFRGRLMALATIRATIDNPEFESTFFSVKGERTQTFIGTNAASDLHDVLSQAENLGQLETSEQYGYLVKDSFTGTYVNKDGKTVSTSVMMNKIFNFENGNKRRKAESFMQAGYADGTINQKNGKKTPSAKLSFKQRLEQEINMNNAGFYYNLVPGEASIQYMTFMGNHITANELRTSWENVHDIFKGYFISEVRLSRDNRKIAKVEGHDKKDLRFFKPILNAYEPGLHDKIVKDKRTAEQLYDAYKSKIDAAVEAYIKNEAKITDITLKEYKLAAINAKGRMSLSNIKLGDSDDLSIQEYERALQALASNYIINNIELHKLLYSDPYQYAEELKRIKSFMSPRRAIINNSPKMNRLLEKLWNKNYAKGDIGYTDMLRDYFRTATLSDVYGVIDLARYGRYKETDGAGIITFKAYRNFRIRAGEWNSDEERQYEYDVAWEKFDKNMDLSPREIKLLEKGNPQIRSAYVALKPIVSGNKANGKSYNDIVLDKYSLYPLSYRIMKEINKDANALKLSDKMQREDIDYVIFESGRKVGNDGLNDVYNEDGKFNEDPYPDNKLTNVPFSIMSIQSEVPSKEDEEVTRGSQVTKLITMDFVEGGVPIDFEPEGNFNARYSKWFGLTEEQKLAYNNGKNIYVEIKRNNNLLNALLDDAYNSLLLRMGITLQADKSFKITDFSKTAKTLRDEILSREVNDNIVDALESFENGRAILEATPAYQQIRNILYSIADKTIVRPKMPGSQKVQIPSTLMESERVKLTEINGKQGYTSDFLKFYEDADGKRVCQILVARWFDSDKTDEELLDYFNNTEEGRKEVEALFGIAFRVPTGRQNYIERFEIPKFLPVEFGDNVVVPSAIVEKVGSDFDIDKLFIYFKNIYNNKAGFPKVVRFLTDENSTVGNRYYRWMIEHASQDPKKYVKFLSKGQVKAIREGFQSQFDEIRSRYSDEYKRNKKALRTGLSDLIEKQLPENKGLREQDAYLKKVFEEGESIFWSMSDEAREGYWALKGQMSSQNISGPEEIRRYLALTVALIESGEFDNTNDVMPLIDLERIYEHELEVLGANIEFIKEYKKQAIANYKKQKNAMWAAMQTEKSKEIIALSEELGKEIDNNKVEVAKEMASMDPTMPTLDEFSTWDIYKQNNKRALENAYIESMEQFVSHPMNFERLTKPNSAKVLQDLAKKISELRGIPQFNYTDTSNMLNRRYMTSLRHAFVTGKYAIGIAAVGQTNHSLNQRQPFYIDPERFDLLSLQDKGLLTGGTLDKKDIAIKFKNFNEIRVGKKMYATLSFIKDKLGKNLISDIISQFLDGYVDIPKGPWVMELGATPNVAGTWLFLTKVGVPIKTVAYFMNQPIIRDHLMRTETAGYSWLFIKSIIDDGMDEYKPGAGYVEAKDRVSEIPSDKDLEEMIGKSAVELTPQQRAAQQFMLMEFLKYAKMAEHLFYVTQGSNFDTANLNDPYLLFKKAEQYKRAQASVFAGVSEGEVMSGIDAIMNNSFIGILKDILGNVRNAFAEILVSDQPNVRNVMHQVLAPFVDLNDRDFVKLAQKAVNNLFDWAVQTDQGFYKYVQDILLGDKNVASQVDQFIRDVKKDSNHPLYKNVIIESIKPHYARKSDQPNNLNIVNRDNKVFDQNQIIYGFRELKQHLGSANSALYDRIIMLSILQSGLGRSPISFTSLLPQDDFEKIYNKTMKKLNKIPNLQDFADLRVFERTNWNDADITPYMKAKGGKSKETGRPYYNMNMYFSDQAWPGVTKGIKDKKIPQLLKVSIGSREGASDVVVYTWEKGFEMLPEEDQKLTYDEKIEKVIKMKDDMRKIGDYSFINKGLFQKVYAEGTPFIVEEGDQKQYVNYVYKMINAWGDSHTDGNTYFSANEMYDHAAVSPIDNGFVKVYNEMDDNTILAYFDAARPASAKSVSELNTISVIQEKERPEFDKLPGRSDKKTMTYAGVGSRETPANVLKEIKDFAKYLEAAGYTVNTGLGEDENTRRGADQAFREGATKKNLFGTKDVTERSIAIAKEIHPAPDKLGPIAIKYMARNTNQVFGADLNTPVDFVLAWTPDGITNYRQRTINSGGTGQAIDMASRKGIPVINIKNNPNWREDVKSIISGQRDAAYNDFKNNLERKCD